MGDAVDTLIAYCRANSRVCPQPAPWADLWELLPERRRVDGVWEPSLPLILAAWHSSTNLEKMVRLDEHIRWACEHGAILECGVFLRALSEEDWHHLGD